MITVKGYKVFNPDFTCLNFQYEEGKSYEYNGVVELCKTGFHFCLNPSDCFSYYEFNPNNIVCEVECERVSEEKGSDSKRVCGKINIIRRLPWEEILRICNSGYGNSGSRNSGFYNSTDFSGGIFCSEEPDVICFNKPSGLKMKDIQVPFLDFPVICEFIIESNMTEEEKVSNPDYVTLGGLSKIITNGI